MTAALLLLGLSQAAGLLRRGELPQKEQEIQETQEQDSVVVGTVIRQETAIDAPEGSWRCLLKEGQRAAAGQALFVSGEAENIEQPTEQNAYERHLALLAALRDYQEPGSGGTALKNLMVTEPAESDASVGSERETIRAPDTGIFSQVTDGLEGVLTPAEPETHTADLPPKDPPRALGKLITSDTWYFYTVLPEAPEPGDTLDVQLLGGGFGTCTLTVEWARPCAEGYRAMLSAKDGLEAVSGVRRLWVKILSD